MSKKRRKASNHRRIRSQRKISIRCRLKFLNRCQTSLTKLYYRISILLTISILIITLKIKYMQKQRSFYRLLINRKSIVSTSKSK